MPALKQQILNSDKLNDLVWQSSTSSWTITNSFSAAYLIWDRSKNLATSKLESEREFDYDEFSLEQFYNLILETDIEFSTVTLEQATTIGIEVNKNPFIISGEGILSPASTSSAFNTSILPSPFLASDFVSKKNYLGLSIEHEINFSDRLSLEFEGTFDVAIGDTSRGNASNGWNSCANRVLLSQKSVMSVVIESLAIACNSRGNKIRYFR